MTDFAKIAQGLVKAAAMTADELAAKKGESDMFVQIKRNRERMDICDGHDFEPVPDWRAQGGWLSRIDVRCRRCGGTMKGLEAMTYLRGFAHGSGQNFKAVSEAIFPPTQGAHP